MKKIFLVFTVLMMTTACSIKQRVDSVQVGRSDEVCIQKNPDVRQGFLAEVEKVLTEKQIKYRVLEQLDAAQQCEWTATYTANWAWDLALYMVYAEIKVFHQGRLDGEAIYDARRGGANMNKFIDAEPKIRELIEELIKQKQASLLWYPLQQVAI
ncbi:Sbal_3080 family lipoprotein [Shewanella marisflavi]|uniref:Sbal_3080 family lipoprotein n=1 Tax=Shewanella marisflavi TaxID=260364 RepID=UPI00200EE5CA|nr:Sbal_3080 family lipoprotein [Shewanella marisflavi]MCL1042748.1 Sbal_3080 family lipoprotein [Shewanella marisflavi]